MILKICGITRVADAEAAVAAGATAIGLNFWPGSARAVTRERARAVTAAVGQATALVGVFVDADPDEVIDTVHAVGLTAVQLHGRETPASVTGVPVPVWRAITLETAREERARWPMGTTFLLDATVPGARGGTGVAVNRTDAAAVAREMPIVLAGGLTPDTVAAAIEAVRPVGVDVASGVEEAPGVKSVEKMTRFLHEASRAFERVTHHVN